MTKQMQVVHIGLVGDYPGGMAQVVRRMLEWEVPGVTQVAIPTTRRRHDPLWPLLTIRAILIVCALKVRRKVDVLAVHVSERGSFVREGAVVRTAQRLGIPVALHLHGADFEAFARSHPARCLAVLRRTDLILSLTAGSAAAVISLDCDLEPRVAFYRNSVVVPELEAPRNRANVVLFSGEIGHRKGVDLLLEAWHSLAQRHVTQGWTLRLIGPTSSEIVLPPREELRELGVEILGSLPNSVVAEHQSTASIAVLPSRAEALPVALIESMAHGCAIIASAVGQIPDLVGDGAGLLVEPGSIPELTLALESLMTDPAAQERFSTRGHRRVQERFSADVVSREVCGSWSTIARVRDA